MNNIKAEVGFNEQSHAEYLKKAKDEDVRINHFFDQTNPYGGVTVVWSREEFYKNSKMVRVSVAWCSIADSFSRKIGTFLALKSRYLYQESIILPVGDLEDEVVINRLRRFFLLV